MRASANVLCLALAVATAAACRSRDERVSASAAPSASASAPTSAPSAATSQAPPAWMFVDAAAPRSSPPPREGSAIARSPKNDALYVADEDRGKVRVKALPDLSQPAVHVAMPGRPAQVVATDERVVVTIRDPSLLLVMRPVAGGLVEVSRTPLPDDAWGVALSADRETAYVTSAWGHAVSAVAIATGAKLWSIDVAREPRGIAVDDRGVVYVSHLTQAALTRIDVRDGAPVAKSIALAAAPLRAPRGRALEASLGYALAFSRDRKRLFAPRHALGALGVTAWFGAATVDVLVTANDSPLSPARGADPMLAGDGIDIPCAKKQDPLRPCGKFPHSDPLIDGPEGPIPLGDPSAFVQPRAVVYDDARRAVYVASEGTGKVVALDADAIAPALGAPEAIISGCPAVNGLALSADEETLFAYCRGNGKLVAVSLGTYGRIVEHVLTYEPPDDLTAGRALFFDATDRSISGGLACAGCHPEGRDDGHVWHEVETASIPDARRGKDEVWGRDLAKRIFVGDEATVGVKGVARQTPMLAGRVASAGPYGWLGRNKDLEARIAEGTQLHRWRAGPAADPKKVAQLAIYLRRGLVAPPTRAPDALALRGKEIFERKSVGCSACHAGDDQAAIVTTLPARPPPPGFDAEDAPRKTPSLRFVGGTAPYFHDGSAPTLEALIESNDDRMGKTNALSPDERAALVAYLRSL